MATRRPDAATASAASWTSSTLRRGARARVVLEADADVAAAFERERGEAAPDDVAAEHRDQPLQAAAVEHRQVGVRLGSVGGNPKGSASPPK